LFLQLAEDILVKASYAVQQKFGEKIENPSHDLIFSLFFEKQTLIIFFILFSLFFK